MRALLPLAARLTSRLAVLLTLASCAAPAPPGADHATAAPSTALECAPRLDPSVAPGPLLRAHAQARELGHTRGARDAAEHIARRTEDGYRLRRLTSTALMGLGLFLAGALAAGLLLGLLGKRPSVRYARRLDEAVDQPLAAVRALAGAASGPAARLFARLEVPLGAAERRAERLLDLASPLEAERDSELARTQLEALYAKLAALADAAERLHVHASTWRERLSEGAPPEAQAAAEAQIDAFAASVEAIA